MLTRQKKRRVASSGHSESKCNSRLLGLTSRLQHTRRITTEAKAKVVAAAWGTALFHFFAALAILNPDDLKTRTNCTRTI